MKVSISSYWKCQLIGWGACSLFVYLIGRFPFMNSLIATIFGLAFTHFLRFLIKQFNILDKNTVSQIIYLLLINVIFGFFAAWLLEWVVSITIEKNLSPNSFRLSFFGRVFRDYQLTLPVSTGWTAIYFAVHYIRDFKKTEQEKNDLRIGLAESETMALRAQMNPQFIFDNMNSIKSLVTKNENDKAAHYLTTFSKLIRILFQNSDKRKISLFEELETCKLYTQLERMNGSKEVEFIFNVDETIDLKHIKVPSLAVQSTIEKAIWHGSAPEKTERRIVISVKQSDDEVQCVIDDNGISETLSKKNKQVDESIRPTKSIGLTQSGAELNKLLIENENAILIVNKKGEDGKPEGVKIILSFKENRN